MHKAVVASTSPMPAPIETKEAPEQLKWMNPLKHEMQSNKRLIIVIQGRKKKTYQKILPNSDEQKLF